MLVGYLENTFKFHILCSIIGLITTHSIIFASTLWFHYSKFAISHRSITTKVIFNSVVRKAIVPILLNRLQLVSTYVITAGKFVQARRCSILSFTFKWISKRNNKVMTVPLLSAGCIWRKDTRKWHIQVFTLHLLNYLFGATCLYRRILQIRAKFSTNISIIINLYSFRLIMWFIIIVIFSKIGRP
jgi:hypothetical protein